MRKFCLILLFCTPMSALAQVAPTQNCESDNHRAFDFWLGNWDVTLADGSAAGTNEITAVQNGCVVLEQWTSATSAFTGTSMNFYDSSKDKWRQLWLDNQGSVLELEGKRSDNQMILRSVTFNDANGNESYHQITWTLNDNGSVRQLWQTFVSGQETQVAFDGLYQKQ